MQTALVLLVIVVAALALRRRLLLVVIGAVAGWVLIPGAAGGAITGITGLHPATALVIVSFALEVVNPQAWLRMAVADRRLLYGALAAFLLLSAGFTFRLGSGGTMTFLNMILAPILLFAMADAARAQNTVRMSMMTAAVVTLGCIEAVLGLAQTLLAQNLFWVAQLSQYTWYATEFNRAQGTLDHPIIFGNLCAMCIPLAGTLKRMRWTTVACALLVVGVVVSQTRSAIVPALVGLLAVVLLSKTGPVRRFLFAGALAATGVIALNSSIAAALLDRVASDGGSADLRDIAYSWFASNWSDYFWTPGGYGSSFTTAANAGLGSSFESAPIMFFLDFGALAVAIFFAAQALIVLRGLRVSRQSALLSVGAAIAVALPFTSSIYGWANASTTLTWALLAMVAVQARLPRPVPESGGAADAAVRKDSDVSTIAPVDHRILPAVPSADEARSGPILVRASPPG